MDSPFGNPFESRYISLNRGNYYFSCFLFFFLFFMIITFIVYTSYFNFYFRALLVFVKYFSKNTYFSKILISEKGKCIQAVWLSQKSFYKKSIPVFSSSKHFTEIVLRKMNFGVWFVQTFYGKCFTEN